MTEITSTTHLDAIPEEHRGFAHEKMASLHLNSPEGPRQIWDVDTSDTDRRVSDISKFIELSTRELGEDAYHETITKHSLELASHYALAAQTWAENSPDSEEARIDAEESLESLLVWSLIAGGPERKEDGIRPLIEQGHGLSVMRAVHRMAEKGLVVKEESFFGGTQYKPIDVATKKYEKSISAAYGVNLDPTVSDEYFGTPLTTESQAQIVKTLTAEEVTVAYAVAERHSGQEASAEMLASAYLETLAPRHHYEINDKEAAETLKEIADRHPEVLGSDSNNELFERILKKRAIGTERNYIHNNQEALHLHFLVARLLSDPETPEAAKHFALGMISDRVDFEEGMLEWPLQFIEATEEGKERAQRLVAERARQNEAEAIHLMETTEVPSALAMQLDASETSIRSVLANYSGDRRLLLSTFEDIASERELVPFEKTILQEKLLGDTYDRRSWSADIDNWRQFFASSVVERLSEMFPGGLPESLSSTTKSAINRSAFGLEGFIGSVDLIAKSEIGAQCSEDGELFAHADHVFTYVLDEQSVEMAQRRLDRVSQLYEAGLFSVKGPEGIELPINKDTFNMLQEDAERAVESLRATMEAPLVVEMIRSSPSDEMSRSIMRDIIFHYGVWNEALGSGELQSIDTEVIEFVKKQVYQDGAQASSFIEAMGQLRVEDEQTYDTIILRSLIDRDSIDKLPTNPTKLIDRLPNSDTRELYIRILEIKRDNPGMETDSIYGYLVENGLMSREQVTLLQAVDISESPDLTRLLVEKKQYLEDRKVRSKWLAGEYPDASLQMLASAWSSRREALNDGTIDTPYEIVRWVAITKLREIADRDNELIGGKSFRELLDARPDLAYELARNYNPMKSAQAMRRYFEIETQGAFHRSEFVPGSTTVSLGGRSYEVEWLEKGSPAFFSMGADTGCCMTIGGVSENCIWQAMEDPKYSGMVVRVNGKVRAQSVAYLAKDEQDNQTLVLDNIEMNGGTDPLVMRQVYQMGLTQLLDQGFIHREIKHVNVGEGYTKTPYTDLASVTPIPGPAGIYTDATSQRRLLERA